MPELNREAKPTEMDLRLRGELFSMVNQERLERSLPLFAKPLKRFRYRDGLDAVAQGHCHAMIDQGFYGHEDLNGLRVGSRLAAAGFRLYLYSENVGWLAPHTAGAAFEKFMASSVHRGNILNAGYTYLGIGTAVCLEPAIFWNTTNTPPTKTTLGPSGRFWSMTLYTPPVGG